MTELICIVCPKGCHISVDEENGYSVKGNACKRGEDYGKKELVNPTRVITSTVKIKGALHRRIPVKTNRDIPKGLVFDAMRLLDNLELTAPVRAGDIVYENIFGSGIHFMATKTEEIYH